MLMMLPNLVWLYSQQGPSVWIEGLIIPITLLTFLFAFLGRKIWLACLFLVPFSALALPEAAYIFTYLHPTNAEILATLVATNPREAIEYLDWMLLPMALSVVLGLMTALLAARWSWQDDITWKHQSCSWVVAAAITIPIAACFSEFTSSGGTISQRLRSGFNTVAGVASSFEPGFPFGLPQRFCEYFREWKQLQSETMYRKAFRFHAYRQSEIHQRQIYVLVIGESSRRDHWQIFGYGRATNPELSKVTNLIRVPDMVTSWPASIMAIPLVITRKPISDSSLVWKESSIIRVMAEADYETYWISNQLALGKYDSPVSSFAYEAQHVSFLNHASWSSAGSYDDVLIRPLRDAIEKSQNDLFIVLHMMGSHTSYDFRYPIAFKRFSPIMSDPGIDDRNGRIENSYDNTIFYTDHVLSQIIDTLKHSNAVSALFFESDHGEDLPNSKCTLSAHGNGTPYDFQIPAFLWYSDRYAKEFPTRIASFRNNSEKRTLSADTFSSLADMANVSIPSNDTSWNLFSSTWRYRPRIINGYWKTDIDQSIQSKKCKLLMPANQ